MTSYCISIYDGIKAESFYLTDYSDSETLLKSAVYSLMRKKYHQYKVYVHNFSHFDGVFLLGVLSSLSDNIRPIIRDGRIIDLSFSFGEGKTKYKLYFRDSYLLLPDSLRKLALNFKVTNKGLFPYKFVNNDKISLDYKGFVPTINFFDDISHLEYTEYCKEFKYKPWDLQVETIKYCELDCIVLYRIIEKFNEKIFTTFRADILKYPTLSSLAFAIYRQKFLGKAEIPIIDGEMFNFFKEGYTGGAVDVYKPYGEKVYRYDVNSLYPYVMDSSPMPVGNPTYFEGDIISSLVSQTGKATHPFGVFEVEVEAPENLNIPNIQKGSKRQVLKSLLNNLIGRFGLNFVKPITKSVRKSALDAILATKEIKTLKQINENNFIVIYLPLVDKDICESHGLDYLKVILNERQKNINSRVNIFQDTSIIISVFTTAYARIYMHQVKLDILASGGNSFLFGYRFYYNWFKFG